LLAHEYFGKYTAEGPPTVRIQDPSPGTLVAGQPVVLQLDGLARYLEYVHERPIHLMVVSDDLQEFDHIHPEVNEQGAWLAPHTFRHGGRYRLYADYTPPGSNQRVEFFDVAVQGPARPRPVKLEAPLELPAGEDVELTFNLGSISG